MNTTEIFLKSKNGTTLWTRACSRLPVPVDDEFPLQVLTPPLTRDHAQMPEVVNIEATGLGGKDLGVVGPWNISIRTDPKGQNVYGPSLATVEDVVLELCRSGGTSTKHVTSLALSATDLKSHRFQHERSKATSLCCRGRGPSLMSSVVPTTGRSPRSAHRGCLAIVPTMAAASGIQPSLAMDCSACVIPLLAPP